MAIVQSIDSAREQRIGPHGVAEKALNDALGRAEGALEVLRARHADGSLPLLWLPKTHDDLVPIRDTARRLAENATDVVLLGTGGSSLGGQTLAQLAGHAVNLQRIADLDEKLFKNDAIPRRELEQAQTDAAAAVADRDAAIEQMRSLGVDEQSITAVRENRATAA